MSVTFPCPAHTAHYRLLYTSHAHVSLRRSTGWMAGVDSLAPVGLLRPRAFAHLRVRRRACVLMTRFPRRRRSGRFGRFHIHFGSRAQSSDVSTRSTNLWPPRVKGADTYENRLCPYIAVNVVPDSQRRQKMNPHLTAIHTTSVPIPTQRTCTCTCTCTCM